MGWARWDGMGWMGWVAQNEPKDAWKGEKAALMKRSTKTIRSHGATTGAPTEPWVADARCPLSGTSAAVAQLRHPPSAPVLTVFPQGSERVISHHRPSCLGACSDGQLTLFFDRRHASTAPSSMHRWEGPIVALPRVAAAALVVVAPDRSSRSRNKEDGRRRPGRAGQARRAGPPPSGALPGQGIVGNARDRA